MDCSKTEVFLKEWRRMCKAVGCSMCEISKKGRGCKIFLMCEPAEAIKIVQEWSDKHPVEIDWTKVPPNTPVLVRDNVASVWIERCFVAYLPIRAGGKFAVFNNCYLRNPVSQEEAVGIDYYYECKLTDSVDPTPYYKDGE